MRADARTQAKIEPTSAAHQNAELLNEHGQRQERLASPRPTDAPPARAIPASPSSQGWPRMAFGRDFSQVRPHTTAAAATQVKAAAAGGRLIQRQAAPGGATPNEAVMSAPGLIVADEAEELRPGQMRKSEFLGQLRSASCRAADEALAPTGQNSEGCPYLDRWFGYYQEQDSQHVERALRRFAPETARATTASEYIPIVAERVRRGVQAWARTGEMPAGLPLMPPGGGLLGAAGGLISGAASLVSGIGSLFAKDRNGGGATGHSQPQEVQAQLGDGRSLDSGVRAGMESAFGANFAHVRLHTDVQAARLSDRLDARAFTVGQHVAFAAGEYRPGTPVGDALIAHELAHVVQQAGAKTAAPEQATRYSALEEDADASAVGAVLSLWDGTGGALADLGHSAPLRLRSGLRLQRCGRRTTYPAVDVSTLPEGRIRQAVTALSQSDELVDRNTANQIVSGNIHPYYIEDLAQPANVDDVVRTRGLDPSVYTIYLHPDTGDEMLVQRNYVGFRSGNAIFGQRSLPLVRWQTLLVHETSHALNPDTTTPIDRYKDEFRAYWVAEYRHVDDLDERARQIREHILRDYVFIKEAYDNDPTVQAEIDAYTRPEGNLTNQ